MKILKESQYKKAGGAGDASLHEVGKTRIRLDWANSLKDMNLPNRKMLITVKLINPIFEQQFDTSKELVFRLSLDNYTADELSFLQENVRGLTNKLASSIEKVSAKFAEEINSLLAKY